MLLAQSQSTIAGAKSYIWFFIVEILYDEIVRVAIRSTNGV